tara:strand:- start:2402 stop:2995 length:594 start_codon:yes stop_codon:yes gene_type:complete
MGSIKGQKHNPYIDGKYGHLNPNDVVFTPDWLAKQIVDMFDIKGKVLEPCKGEGAFLQYLPTDTDWCEIAEGKNYYDYDKKVDWIVTNPPYSDYNRFLEHSFKLADNIVLLVPVAKMFKSMGTMSDIFNYGGFVEIHTLPSSKAGFPFGFPSAVYYLKRGYKGDTKIKMLDGITFKKRGKKIKEKEIEAEGLFNAQT